MPYTPADHRCACGTRLRLELRKIPGREHSELCCRCWRKTPEGRAHWGKQKKRYREADPEKIRRQQREADKRYREANPEKIRRQQREAHKRYREANSESRMMRIREQKKQYAERNPILIRLRRRLGAAVRRAKATKAASTLGLAGCTKAELVAHIEAQFQSGMTWENRGLWHIDHIIPCAAFDLTDPDQQRSCFHYSNLRPLWAEENLKKSDKGIEPIGKKRRGRMAAAYQICLLP